MSEQLKEFLLQSLQQEQAGVLVYQTALECVTNEELRREWTQCLAQTERHVEVLRRTCQSFGLDPDESVSGREIVQHVGESLVVAMKTALVDRMDPTAAEIVACECVVLAETKDQAVWELLAECAAELDGEPAHLLTQACEKIVREEEEQRTRAKRWFKQLWRKYLNLKSSWPVPGLDQPFRRDLRKI